MKRIFLFVATNVAVLAMLGIVMNLLGIQSLLNERGTGLDLQALLIFSAVIGFAGSLISLAISKWSGQTPDRRAGHRFATKLDGELADQYRQAPCRCGRNRLSRSRDLRLAGPERLCYRREPQQCARRRQHGAIDAARPCRGGRRAWARDQPRRQRRHGHARIAAGGREHLRDFPIARDRVRRRPASCSAPSAGMARVSLLRAWWRRSRSAFSPPRS